MSLLCFSCFLQVFFQSSAQLKVKKYSVRRPAWELRKIVLLHSTKQGITELVKIGKIHARNE